ncbi:MAG: AAA family ATPase [Deltaproteobacteria bacterium]|nr:AAA family ATPase [Deltaproteobacteria bacterium]
MSAEPETLTITPAWRRALALLEEGVRPVLLTGRAGTGKSTLLQRFRDQTRKQVAVLAPTGVAAVNIRGQTIHSFFGFRPDITPERAHAAGQKAERRADKLYTTLETLVLDEISMVRADLFTCVDRFLRAARRCPLEPFGGVQLIMIGDLYQLPPVVKTAEREIFASLYPGPYFFHAPVFAELSLELVELDVVFRQRDETFIRLLNAVRNNSVTAADLAQLNSRCEPKFTPGDEPYITLTTTNDAAAAINAEHLQALRGKGVRWHGELQGDFPAEQCPTETEMTLKVGAQVMLLNNDSFGRWVNGTIGEVMAMSRSEAHVEVLLEDGETVEVEPYTWKMYRYTVDPKHHTLDTEAVGSFTQLPLRLAWAVTIHKSQGKTFDHVIVDLGRGAFATGQLYVGLSRCRTFEGLVLRHQVRASDVRVDWRVVKFLTGMQYARSEAAMPLAEKMLQLEAAVALQRPVAITYLKATDEPSQRVLEPREVGEMAYNGRSFLGLRAYCRERGEERVFRVDRILSLQPVEE